MIWIYKWVLHSLHGQAHALFPKYWTLAKFSFPLLISSRTQWSLVGVYKTKIGRKTAGKGDLVSINRCVLEGASDYYVRGFTLLWLHWGWCTYKNFLSNVSRFFHCMLAGLVEWISMICRSFSFEIMFHELYFLYLIFACWNTPLDHDFLSYIYKHTTKFRQPRFFKLELMQAIFKASFKFCPITVTFDLPSMFSRSFASTFYS